MSNVSVGLRERAERVGARSRQARALHIVPREGVGGVEVAARLACANLDGALGLHFLAGPTPRDERGTSPFAPGAMRQVIEAVRANDQAVLIFSLWKSAPAMALLRVMFPKRRFVTFLHSARAVHPLDALFTALMLRMADTVWADSTQTLAARQGRADRPRRVISYLPRKPAPRTAETPRPRLIYWGRLSKEKDLHRALAIVAALARRVDRVSFEVVGRDAGERAALSRRARQLGIEDNVHFVGELPFDEIADRAAAASFYLQTSYFEGMAVAVAEAMQLGLVPVVTPVGEIARYCVDGDNSVIVEEAESAAVAIAALIGDPQRYAVLRDAAINTWRGVAAYDEDLMAAVEELSNGCL